MADIVPLLERASLLLEQGRPRDAEKQLADALRLDPENHFALSLMARCKYDLRQIPEGIELIKRAIQMAPQEPYYYYLLAFGYYRQDNNQAAMRYLRQAIEIDPWTAEYFGLWSHILIDEKDFKQALEKADAGLAVDAENITCLNARATALNKLRRVDDAILTMQDALDKDPENAWTHNTVGWNLLEKGRHKDAVTHFKEALRLEPNHIGAREGLKQSLKAKIPPYKWLQQYSFWLNNKGKNARMAIPLILYFGVQAIGRLSDSSNGWLAIVGAVVVVLYLLFAATSWFINPLANFFLLFHKDGKYALSSKEKINALCTVICLLAGIAMLVVAGATTLPGDPQLLFYTGLATMSLGLPLGHMDFPIRFKGSGLLQWVSVGLVLFGAVAIALTFAGHPDAYSILKGYGIAFVAYTWASAFLK